MSPADDSGLSETYRRALAPFEEDVRRLAPRDAEIIDAHTHLGLDEDGRSLDLDGLLAMLDGAGARRACVFPLHDPERRPAYTVPNDRVLAWAAQSEGRLVPFCRLDPAEDPVREGERAIAAGARGIKLHPRAQEFDFGGGGEMDGIFALAERAQVPILIHAGRGLPPIADGLADMALRHPDATLILAHAAICDQAILTERLAEHPRILYDTSTFFTIDLIELLARVPPERVVFASDPPYGQTASGLHAILRVAAQAGLPESSLRAILGETMASLIDTGTLPAAGEPARGPLITLSGQLARVYGYACLAGPAMFGGAVEQALAMIDMALAACRSPAGDREGTDGEALSTIEAALEAARHLCAQTPDRGEPAARAAIDLIHRVIVHAATAIPDGGVAADAPGGLAGYATGLS